MKTGDLITSLAKQSGVELTDDQNTAISEIATDLPDEIANSIQGSLFTKESALANPDIIAKLKADSLDPVDTKLKEMAKSFGLDEGFMHNLKETKGTYNRIDSVSKAILASNKAALLKAAESAGTGDSKELKQTIADLNKQIADHSENTVSKADHDAMIAEHNGVLSENAIAMLNMKSNSLFSNQNWAMDVDASVNVTTAKTLFNAELATKGVKMVDENGTLKLQTTEGSPYYENNLEVTPQDFANNLLAGKKLLKVTDANGTPPAQKTLTGIDGIDPSVMAAAAKALASTKQFEESIV